MSEKMIFMYCRLYFVWTEAIPESINCVSCIVRPTERSWAIRSSLVCLIIVSVYWTATWMINPIGDNQPIFVRACMNPNGNYTLEFDKWWAFSAIIGCTMGLSIVLCASLFIWLSLQQNETTLITTKVRKTYFHNF